MSDKWWEDLNDVWSDKKVTYLASGGKDPNDPNYWMGDFVFHRFFGTDDYDATAVRTVLVEAKHWNEWIEWLKHHTVGKSLLPLYTRPLEHIIMSHKGFRIIKWVDEYRPFEFIHNQ